MQGYENANKIPVKVRADHMYDGKIEPLLMRTRTSPAMRVVVEDVCEAPALKAGGQGTRYTCLLGGKRIYLFNDNGEWFLEVENGLFWFVDENGTVISISNDD